MASLKLRRFASRVARREDHSKRTAMPSSSGRSAAPRFESLEHRLMLTDIWVNTAQDIVDGDYSSISALIDNPGDDGHISLREAVLATNRTPGRDDIRFDPSLDGVPITLSIEGRDEDAGFTGDLDLTDDVVIFGNGWTDSNRIPTPRTIIDGGGIDRIFDISENILGAFAQVELKGGHTESDGFAGSGGAVRSLVVTRIISSIISGNSTSGEDAAGGAIYSTKSVNLANSIVVDNFTTGVDADGGAVSAAGVLGVRYSTLSGNYTSGDGARGGAMYVGMEQLLTMERSEIKITNGTVVSGNFTTGVGASGGGIFVEGAGRLAVRIIGSDISGNSTLGGNAVGGGIAAGDDVLLAGSTVSNNSTQGSYAAGGGIFTEGDLHLDSIYTGPVSPLGPGPIVPAGNTISGNSTMGKNAFGGGIVARGDITIVGSTISGNSTAGIWSDGGGVHSFASITLTASTVIGNSTAGIETFGGGVSAVDNITISSSIVAGNIASDASAQGDDLFAFGSLSVARSLIGDNDGTLLAEAQTAGAAGNLIGSSTGGGTIDPMLAALADNGGPTLTHGLLPESPAIDGGRLHGDEFDQRGEPNFVRVIGQFPDMGAFEGTVDPPPAALPGDANRDGRFNTDDLLLLLAGQKFNKNEWATWEQGDWNADGRFNVDDLLLALAEDNFNAAVAATEARALAATLTSDAIDHYHSQEETSNRRPLDAEPIHIDSNVLLAGQRRSLTR